jgi:hypothetical protein
VGIAALVLVAPARSQDPALTVDAAGEVRVVVDVAATPAQVLAVLADPVVAGRLPPEVLSVAPRTRGTCTELGVSVEGPWSPLTYTSLRCPTATGYHYALVKSEDLSAYEAEWSVVASPSGGATVTYRLLTEVNLPVPHRLVQNGVVKSARETIRRLVGKLPGR